MGRPEGEKGFLLEDLGRIDVGRENLGAYMPVLVYRLFQFSIRDVLSVEYGSEKTREIFRDCGYLAGIRFAKNMLNLSGNTDFFIANLQRVLQEQSIGILRIEDADLEKLVFTVTVSEDLDCSGLPVTGELVCDYDEGLLAGILESYFRRKFEVREINCWAAGDRTCRFIARAIEVDGHEGQ